MSDFGRRLWGELLRLGYRSKSEVVRACFGFSASHYPKVDGKLLRSWLKGGQPTLGGVELLEGLGVDVYFCRHGRGGAFPKMCPEDGFDVSSWAQRYGGLRVEWRAPEMLHMADFWARVTGDKLQAEVTAELLWVGFYEAMLLRAQIGGRWPISPIRSNGHVVRTEDAVPPSELSNLFLWFVQWSETLGVVLPAETHPELTTHLLLQTAGWLSLANDSEHDQAA
ncbi:hypothetical protein [Gemmatimonas sp.]|uniref:hypothetical protein n=1 Tax=Gemmatimonas sp. TaxID=1962908 RepID=UPI003DA42881